MTIGYIDAAGKTKTAKVLEVHSDDTVLLDHSENGDGSHTALAHFDENKKAKNSFHALDSNGAPAKKTPAASS